MSELLQDDDPEPQPTDRHEYPRNWQTDLAYDDYESAESYAKEHQITLEIEAAAREQEAIEHLSMQAGILLDSENATGSPSDRTLRTDAALLRREIIDGAWKFTFSDSLTGDARCRKWRLGGDIISWCESEQRHEPAEEVIERLNAVFAHDTTSTEPKRAIHPGLRLKRMLAAAILKS